MKELQTERLILRQWREEDFEPFADFYGDEEMARYVGGPCSREQAWRRMAAEIGHWTLRGYGYWAVEEKETREFVGGVGVSPNRTGSSWSWKTGPNLRIDPLQQEQTAAFLTD